MELLLNLLDAAEAAYEMNPTPKLEKWIDLLEKKICQRFDNEAKKVRK